MSYREKRIERKLEKTRRQHNRHAGPPVHTPEPLVPLNAKQRRYMNALSNSEQVFTLGPAGTGKTYIAAASAADKFRNGQISKIILTRPAVGVDEEHGFLPGGLKDKLAPWLVPFTEVLERRLGKVAYQNAVLKGHIEIVPLAFMRGRTFSDAFVLLDEAQNCTLRQLKMVLTRIGERCTLVVNGDISQTDLGSDSGLSTVLDMISRQRLDIPIIEFTPEDVVRSGVCALWTEAFRKYEASIR